MQAAYCSVPSVTDRRGELRGTGLAILTGAHAIALLVTSLSRIGHAVPGSPGWSYAVTAAAVLGLGLGAVLGTVRPIEPAPRTARLWYGPAAFAGLVIALEVPPLVDAARLVTPIVLVGLATVLAGAGDVLTSVITGSGLRSGSVPAVVLGAALGLAAGTVVVAEGTPPLLWVVLGAGGYVAIGALIGRPPGVRPAFVLLLLVPVLAVGPATMDDSTVRTPASTIRVAPALSGTAQLTVNGAPAGDIRDAWSWERDNPYAGAPYTLPRTFDRVLVLGAGGGNAVGRALAAEPTRVDAVEPDRGLVSVARRYRPDHAYADSRVTVHEQDPRAALRRLTAPYDLIVLARAEPRLLTPTTLERTRELLNPGGLLAVQDADREYLEPAVRGVRSVFGHAPCVDTSASGFAVVAAADPGLQSCPASGPVAAGSPLTEDRPFTTATAGWLLGVAGAILLLLAAVATVVVRATGFRARHRPRPYPLVVAAGTVHGVAITPILRDLPVAAWALPLTVLGTWLAALLVLCRWAARLPSGRAVRSGAAVVATIALFAAAFAPTGPLGFAGAVPRLTMTAVLGALPVLLGAFLLATTYGAARTSAVPDVTGGVVGIVAGVAVGVVLAGTVGFVGYPGLSILAGVLMLGYAVLTASRAQRAQVLPAVE